MGLVVLGDHQQARGPLVEAVDDARPEDAAHPGEVVHVAEQRVHERAARRAGARVHDEAGRLVHDDQVAVLVHDGHVDVLGLRLGGDGGGHGDADGLSGAQPGRGPRAVPVEQNAALVDEGLEPGSGEGRQALNEPHVESQAHGLVAGDEVVAAGP